MCANATNDTGVSGRMFKSCQPDQRTSSSEHILWVTAPLHVPSTGFELNCGRSPGFGAAKYPVAFRASPGGVHCEGAPEWAAQGVQG